MNWGKILVVISIFISALIMSFTVNKIECKQYEVKKRRSIYLWLCNLCWFLGVVQGTVLYVLRVRC